MADIRKVDGMEISDDLPFQMATWKTILVEDGRPIEDRMSRARVEVEDILEAARKLQGLERMDQIKYAVLERSGGISIIPAARG